MPYTVLVRSTRSAFRGPFGLQYGGLWNATRFEQIAWRSWTRSAQPLPCKRAHVQSRLELGSKRSGREKDRP